MATKDIRTSTQDTICDVCGRTLLRGERADVYLDGTARRSVCELCKDRALHEGWVREGTVTGYEDNVAPPDRRRSLLSRLRGRRENAASGTSAAATLRDDLDGHAWNQAAHPDPAPAPEPPPRAPREPRIPRPRRAPQLRARATAEERGGAPTREPRHVRAIPTSMEQKIAAAMQLFNDSEHPRTIAGVARSLGAPGVAVVPSAEHASLVALTVSWELCWYRYEVDLSDEVPSVRTVAQGYELTELPPEELQRNAVMDERGLLQLSS